jgi:hypothetical protein
VVCSGERGTVKPTWSWATPRYTKLPHKLRRSDVATLTITETENLRHAQSQVAAVARRLAEPKPLTNEESRVMRDLLKQANDKIKVVVTMKGHYHK